MPSGPRGEAFPWVSNSTGKNSDMKPPEHLTPDSQSWWQGICDDYVLESHRHRLLTLAVEAWDLAEQAREILDGSGITFGGREGGMRAHPCCSIERDSRAAFASLVKQLGLDDDGDTRAPGRPPGIFHTANGKRAS